MKLIKRVFIPLALSFCILSSFVACDISDIVDVDDIIGILDGLSSGKIDEDNIIDGIFESDTVRVDHFLEETDTASPYESETGDIVDIENIDFNKAEYNILTLAQTDYEFLAEPNGDVMEQAVYRRNAIVEKTVNVRINVTSLDVPIQRPEEFINLYRSGVLIGDTDVSLVSAPISMHNVLAIEGACQDLTEELNGSYSIDLTADRWCKNYYDNCNVGGSFYVAVGDISYSLYENAMVVFFNEAMASKIAVDENGDSVDLYSLVEKGDWTYGAMAEYTKNAVSYVSSSDKTYGLATSVLGARGFVTAFDADYAERDHSTYPELYLFPTVANEKTVNVVDGIVGFLLGGSDDYVKLNTTAGVGSVTELNKLFSEGRALFYTQTLSAALELNESAEAYGIIPMPKLNEEQTEYLTYVNETVSGVSVPIGVRSTLLSFVVADTLCAVSCETVRPAYYDAITRGQYSLDTDVAERFDIIRNSMTISFVQAYGRMLEYPDRAIDVLIRQGGSVSYKDHYADNYADYKKMLDNVNSLLRELADSRGDNSFVESDTSNRWDETETDKHYETNNDFITNF